MRPIPVVLTVDSLVKEFPSGQARRLLPSKAREVHRAVDSVSLELRWGEILGLAGGSGSGKTTLARCIMRLIEPSSGKVLLGDVDLLRAEGQGLRRCRRRLQMVFQDPYASLNPLYTVGQAIKEVGSVHRLFDGRDADRFVDELLDRVQLPSTAANRRPRELSGGQRQRVAIARALAVRPELLIADEAVSALDVSVQAQLLKLILELREQLGLSIIFVTHQLAVLAEIADRIAVMQTGRVVEVGRAADVLRAPQHEYTQKLLSAHPRVDPSFRIR